MKTKGEFVGLIKEVPYNQRCNIYAAVKEVEGLSIFSIGKEPRTLVIRITKKNNEEIIYKEVIDEFYLAIESKVQ